MKKLLTSLLLLLPIWLCAEVKFEDLTPQHRLGQTLVIFVDIDSAERAKEAIENGQVGGVLIQWGNYSLEQTTALINKLQSWADNSPHKIPLLISIDYEGGTVYTPITLGFDYLPTNMMLTATQDEEEVATLAYLAGTVLRRSGVHINFSPVLDVNSNPYNPIIGVRSFGSDPANVTKMGISLINGFKAAGIISIVKHFPGHGDTAEDSHYKVPIVKASYNELQRIHFPPFQEAIKHGVSGVMTGHIIYPALDRKNIATFSKPILVDLLQKQMGFKGLIVTDSLDMQGAMEFCTIPNCAYRALTVGSDMILLGRYVRPVTTFNRVWEQVEKNKTHARVSEAAKKIYDTKKELGLLDGPLPQPDPLDKAYQAQLEKISDQSVTLVRNNTNLIPFSSKIAHKKPTVCAVFFAPTRFADQLMSFSKPFMEKGWEIRSYNAALTPRLKDNERAEECAEGADLLILTSLQWADKTNINQKNAINGLIKKNPNTVFISTMSPYDIPNYPEANTVLATYGLNKYVLETAADIILGNKKARGVMPVALDLETEKPETIKLKN